MTPFPRSVSQAMRYGVMHRCPACGQGKLYYRYLKLVQACSACGEDLSPARADDAPPYLTILIVAHIVGFSGYWVDQAYRPPLWFHAILWSVVIIGLSLFLLPRLKGVVVGIQWAYGMHGFGRLQNQQNKKGQ